MSFSMVIRWSIGPYFFIQPLTKNTAWTSIQTNIVELPSERPL
jgi:hypothetical protein